MGIWVKFMFVGIRMKKIMRWMSILWKVFVKFGGEC